MTAATIEQQVQTAIRAESKEAINGVIAELQRRKANAVDYRVQGRGLSLTTEEEGGNRLTLDLGGVAGQVAYDVSNVAHGQLASITGIHGSYYKRLREEATPLLATNVNHWLGQSRKSHIVRTLDNRVRAILSDGYRALDSSDLVFETFDTLTELGAEITRLDLTDERFYLRALAPGWKQKIEHQREVGRQHIANLAEIGGADDDWVIPGVVISNSDVGVGALKLERLFYRLRCYNGQVGDDVYARVHRGGKQTEDGVLSQETLGLQNVAIWAEVRDVIRAAFDPAKFAETIRALGLATGKGIDEPVQAVEIVAKHYGVTEADQQRILNAFISDGEGSTVFGLLQAITATAREKQNYDEGVALERIGGRLLDDADRLLVPVRSR